MTSKSLPLAASGKIGARVREFSAVNIMNRTSDLLLDAYSGGGAAHGLNDFIISVDARADKARADKSRANKSRANKSRANKSRPPKVQFEDSAEAEVAVAAAAAAAAAAEPYGITDSVVAVDGRDDLSESSDSSDSSDSSPDNDLIHSINETGSVDESNAELALGENIKARRAKKATHAWWLGSEAKDDFDSLNQEDGPSFPQFGLNSSFGVAYGGFHYLSDESDCGCGGGGDGENDGENDIESNSDSESNSESNSDSESNSESNSESDSESDSENISGGDGVRDGVSKKVSDGISKNILNHYVDI